MRFDRTKADGFYVYAATGSAFRCIGVDVRPGAVAVRNGKRYDVEVVVWPPGDPVESWIRHGGILTTGTKLGHMTLTEATGQVAKWWRPYRREPEAGILNLFAQGASAGDSLASRLRRLNGGDDG